ncbi:MAG TPA: hypothetical protein VEX18_16220, partial [Polyangiaceae bacterium]|nr:hypothetical protein [Polyangiaceae bacterium]
MSTSAEAATFTVNEVGFDSGDIDLSDGQCAATGAVCTLRAAIEQANVLPGTDTIILPARAEHYPVNLSKRTESNFFRLPLEVFDSVNLIGEGAEQSIIDGMGTNPILWVQSAEALVLDVAVQTAEQGFVVRRPYDGARAPTQLVDTGRLNWDSRARIVGDDLLVTSRDGGVLRYAEATGESRGHAVPPSVEGAFLDVSDVSLGPDGLLYATRQNGGDVMRFEYPAGTLVDVFVPGGPFSARSLTWESFAGGVAGLLVTRFG